MKLLQRLFRVFGVAKTAGSERPDVADVAPAPSPHVVKVTFEQCERLRAAARAGAVLDVRYHGGSRPGTIRAIAPICVNNYGVMALDIESDKHKQYTLNKLEIVSVLAGQSRFPPAPAFNLDGLTEVALTGSGLFDIALVDTHSSQTATARLYRGCGANPRVRLVITTDVSIVAAQPIELNEVLGFLDHDAAPRYRQSLEALAARSSFATCAARFSGDDDGEHGFTVAIDLPRPTKLAAQVGIKYKRVVG